MKFKGSWLAISLAVVALGGCGGGGGGADSLVPSNAGGVTRIVAFGDSLSDPGAYALAAAEKLGGRFTVNSPGSRVWTELVAADYGLPLLPNQVVTDAGPQRNANGTSYAEGGSRVTVVNASAAELQAVANGPDAPTREQLTALLIDQVNVDGLMTTQFPCPPAGLSDAQFTKSVFGVTSAGDVERIGANYNPNLAGCIQREAVPLSATNTALTIERVYPKNNAGIGYYVSNLNNGVADVLGAGGAGLKTRSGITTLPITEQTERFLPNATTTAISNGGQSLVTVLGGANDLFTIIGLVTATPARLPAPSATDMSNRTNIAVSQTAQRLAQEVRRLNGLGYSKILVGNIPDLSKTPFLETSVQLAIAATARQLGRQLDTNEQNGLRTQLTGLFQGVTVIYNQTLAAALLNNPTAPASGLISGVQILDLFTLFNNLLANNTNLAARGLSTSVDQTKVTACRQGALGSETGGMQSNPRNLPLRTTNSSLFCNQNDLVAPNADSTYLFADGVHPTPRGHELIAEEALRVLRAAGWR